MQHISLNVAESYDHKLRWDYDTFVDSSSNSAGTLDLALLFGLADLVAVGEVRYVHFLVAVRDH